MPTKYFIKSTVCGFILFFSAAVSFGQNNVAKSVRDFFDLIPSEYFSIYCCGENKDEYVKKYVSVRDTANGFMEGSDVKEDPQYQGFKLKVFSSENGKTILGLYSHSIRWEDYYFLEYNGGKLLNVSKAVPRYSQDNIYDFPRIGSTIKVYKKNFSSPAKLINADEKVSRENYLYSLVWQDGKFVVKK